MGSDGREQATPSTGRSRSGGRAGPTGGSGQSLTARWGLGNRPDGLWGGRGTNGAKAGPRAGGAQPKQPHTI